MKKHLNLFYSYNQGNLSSSERIKQLEDNLTRALIVTIKNLENSTQIEFIRRLLAKDKVSSKSFIFDLQNTDNYNTKSDSDRFLIILQRDKSSFTIDDFKNLNTSFLENRTEREKKKLENDIKKHLTSETEADFPIENITIKFAELNSILQLLYGNRPDAWIIGEKESILFETKIGNNKVSKFQIYRHIVGKNGFNIKPSELNKDNARFTILNITWDEISKVFSKLRETVIETEKFLVSQLIEYISMTGQILNLDYITNGEMDGEIHREQFSLFLTQLDAKLAEKGLLFKRKNRNKTELWEIYGIKNEKGEISQDPHFTVGFWDDRIAVYLTTKNKKQITSELAILIEEYFEQIVRTSTFLSRYYLKQIQYNLVDKQVGQMRGELKLPFTFYVQFSEIKKNIKTICNFVLEFAKMNIYKQFELGYEIQFFDFSRIRKDKQENQIRYLNKQLLENPQKIINEFVNFMEETTEMYNLMKK